MFSSEDDAYSIINEAIGRYKTHFDLDFPLYEYTDVTRNDKFDFSMAGVSKLAKFIDKRISENKPVSVPTDYFDRLY